MQPRIDLMANETGAKIGKRIFNVNLAIEQSTLPSDHPGTGGFAREPAERLRLVHRHPHQGGRGRR